MRPLRRLGHAAKMVWRNKKRYAFLSVTIVLSFSLLLGYLLYTDSRNYNNYKEIFSRDRGIVILGTEDKSSAYWERVDRLLEKIHDTHAYPMLSTSLAFIGNAIDPAKPELRIEGGGITVNALPQQVFGLYDGFGSTLEIQWREGEARESIRLAPGEALANEALLSMLPDGATELNEVFGSHTDQDVRHFVKLKLVGTVKPKDSGAEARSTQPTLYVSRAEFNPSEQPDLLWTQRIVIHSPQPEKAYQLGKGLGPGTWVPGAVYRDQDAALKKQQQDARVKAVLTVGLFLLLGINLYSSFSNALNERKFEIGVKRAIGAGAPQIVGQFTLESLLVLLGDLALSVALVTGAGIAYKFFMERTPDDLGRFHVFTLYITPWSVAMFAVCALSLTVVFSLLFSYQATRVQVIDYLKGE